jgi:hypothetical protein
MLSACVRRSSLRLFSRSFASRPPQLDPLIADLIADSNVSTSPQAPNDATQDGPPNFHLPPIDKWRKTFPLTQFATHRISLKNRDTANAVANAFVPRGSKDKVIVEAYPGNSMCFLDYVALREMENASRSWSAHSGTVESTERTDKKNNCFGGRPKLPGISSCTSQCFIVCQFAFTLCHSLWKLPTLE